MPRLALLIRFASFRCLLLAAFVGSVALVFASITSAAEPTRRRPNVVLIMTDDQGHGDLGFHGNPIIRTPVLDGLARESVRLTNFFVSPVCSPTRASLLTGRYNYRTGVVDTYIGRSMMHPDEVTLAEMLADAGYRTGIFGKWHLGDNYPLRPQDQGFHESLVHGGGGIAQPADPPGNTYFDPMLLHNGQWVRTEGYCSDIFTDGAIRFIEEERDEPFFVYLAFNCPHTPLQVPDSYLRPYQEMDLSHERFPDEGYPLPKQANQDATARVYGMVTNIDDNLGRLFARLDELGLRDDTIVIFLTDNGPQQPRYNSGMRGRKGSVYEGGIRVPCFVRWPARLQADRDVERMAAHIDMVPTLLAACGVEPPDDVQIDGLNLLPLLQGADDDAWPDRTLFFQWHRGDEPQQYRAFAARTERYKLVQAAGVQLDASIQPLTFELFDVQADPYEQHDLANENSEIVEDLRRRYEAWFADVSSTRGYDPPRIHLGTEHEDPLTLTRQDWRGPRAGWQPQHLGHWEVLVAQAGSYRITLRFPSREGAKTAVLSIGELTHRQELDADVNECRFEGIVLPTGPARLQAELLGGEQPVGVDYVDVERID